MRIRDCPQGSDQAYLFGSGEVVGRWAIPLWTPIPLLYLKDILKGGLPTELQRARQRRTGRLSVYD